MKKKTIFSCSHCEKGIKIGEKMLSIQVFLESPIDKDTTEQISECSISHVCSSCAYLLSENLTVKVKESKDDLGNAGLYAHCSEQGLTYEIQCSDDLSWTFSQHFSWEEISQLIISKKQKQEPKYLDNLREDEKALSLRYSIQTRDNQLLRI